MTGSWSFERWSGRVEDHHHRPIPSPARRALWWFEFDVTTVVLGSAQRGEVIDGAAARAAGIDVVRRRSGGGAVWLDPSAVTWVDVILPVDDRLWEDDVGRASMWLGEVWASALGDLGVDGLTVHRGPMRRGADADLICFAGRAAGEVLRGDRKIVGISARRNRDGARFQCSVLHHWDPEPLVGLLRTADEHERSALLERSRSVGEGVGALAPDRIVDAVRRRLPD